MKDMNIGTFSAFLRDNFSAETLDEVELAKKLAAVAVQAAEIAQACRLSRRELASKMGLRSTSTLQRIVSKADAPNVTLETLWRLARACGFELKVEFVPRVAEVVEFKPRQVPPPATDDWRSIPPKPDWRREGQEEEEEDAPVLLPQMNAA